MHWSNNPNSGFSPAGVTPWLPVNPNYKDGINVRDQLHNPNSLLNYYKHLLRVRKSTPALIDGEFTPLQTTSKEHFSFVRANAQQTVLVVLNYSGTPTDIDFSRTPQVKGRTLHLIFSSAVRSHTEFLPKRLHIGAFEVFIAEVK
jgi:alpha-glucosidase